MNMADESELLNQNMTVFVWSSKRYAICVILLEDYGFSVD